MLPNLAAASETSRHETTENLCKDNSMITSSNMQLLAVCLL